MPGSFGDSPAPRSWLLNGQDARSPSAFRGSGLRLGRSRLGACPYPWLQPGGGYSVPPFAALLRHEKPYPPKSKINPPHPLQVKRRVLSHIAVINASRKFLSFGQRKCVPNPSLMRLQGHAGGLKPTTQLPNLGLIFHALKLGCPGRGGKPPRPRSR